MLEEENYYEREADKNIDLSQQYAESRHDHAEAKHNLDIIFASKLDQLRNIRSNIGVEMGYLMLLEMGIEGVEQYYGTMIRAEARYKGLERIIEARQAKLSLIQSLLKYRIKEGA